MNKRILLVVILQLFVYISNDDINLEINRARAHNDQTGDLTPLVVSLSSPDKNEKLKAVDLICIVDISGSMSGTNIELVRESLEYLANLMNEQDNLAIVTFESSATTYLPFTKMTSDNKKNVIQKIKTLDADGGTNIYSGLQQGLSLLTNDYSSGQRIASMILLSDGEDNYGFMAEQFKDYIKINGKNNYVFTLHSFGYGDYHDALLMSDISKIRDGSYFYIQKLLDVQDAYVKIYGSLSTVNKVNLELIINSNYQIQKVYGIEDMYEASLTNNNSTFNTKIIQVVYGKTYAFVVLVNIPKDIKKGTEVLRATLSPLGINARYLWDDSLSSFAYEEYIRCICFTYISDGFEKGGYYGGRTIINDGLTWIKTNYNGTINWEGEFNTILIEFNSYNSNAAILSRLRELKTSKIGIHYSDENSYIMNIVDRSHGINLNNLPIMIVSGQKIINIDITKNYYYFYLKEGTGKINNYFFSGKGSSFVIYTDQPGTLNITSLTENIEYYYWNETKNYRIQTIIDFSHGGKFIYKKDFPFEFYTRVDGTRDVTFNIEFLKLEYNEISGEFEHLFEILAYILDDSQIENLENYNNILPSILSNGTYNKELKLGKIVIKKEIISRYLSTRYHNYLYIVINKKSNTIIYNHVEGQFIFVPMDYIYSTIPENYYISSELSVGQNNPHLYTILMESILNKNITIEFTTLGDELDCKILKYQNYPSGSEELFKDYIEYKIIRRQNGSKTYIDVFQSKNSAKKFENVIISIFSKNKDHIAGSDISKLSYTLKYTTYSYVNEIYTINKLARVIVLGFTKFIYMRDMKICYFYTHFALIRRVVTSQIIKITAIIGYRKALRFLQETETREAECKFCNITFDNQIKYNCSLETNGGEIDNIQLDDNINFEDNEAEIISQTPIAENNMNSLQNVGDSDLFDKKLYILDNCTTLIDNIKNEIKITGVINDTEFKYTDLNLTVKNTNESEVNLNNSKNIPCKVIKLNENEKTYTLQCSSKDEEILDFNGAFSDLGNENLIVNLLDDSENSTKIDPEEDKIFNNNFIFKSRKSSGLSKGGIIAILVCGVAAALIAAILAISLRRPSKGGKAIKQASTVSINLNRSDINVK